MKRFLMYIVVAVVLIFCGVSIYYVVRNDEELYETSALSEIIYMNVGEELDIPVNYVDPSKETQITIQSDNESVLSVNQEKWAVLANGAGVATITIRTTNKNLKTFEFNFSIGNGSIEQPYFIRNEEDLRKIGSEEWHLYDHYQLVKDIELTSSWTPIGNSSRMFTGSFSGGSDYHTISNVVIDESINWPYGHAGFFGATGSNAKIENIIFKDVTITGRYIYLGSVVGINGGFIGKTRVINATINNTYEKGYTGGLVGLNRTSNDVYAQISSSEVEKLAIDSKYVAGGISGYNRAGLILNCKVNIEKINMNPNESERTASYFGGLIGVSTSISSGVNSCSRIFPSVLMNCLVEISSLNNLGSKCAGIVGYMFTSGDVNEYGSYSMLLYICESPISPCSVVLKDFSLGDSDSALNYSKRLTKNEMLTRSTYTKNDSTWNLDTIWKLVKDSSIEMDYLGEDFDYQQVSLDNSKVTISTKEDVSNALSMMKANPMAQVTYVIEEELTYSVKNISSWTPIGNEKKPFMGRIETKNGGSLTITGLSVKDQKYAGLFGCVSGVNTYISGITVKGSASGEYVGGLVSYNYGAIIENCSVENFTITASKVAGGIASYNSGDILSCSTSKVEINVGESENTIYVGGTVGLLEDGKIQYVSTLASTKIDVASNSKTYVGGLVGYARNSVVSECANATDDFAQLSGNSENSYVGGLVGYVDSKSKVEKSSVKVLETNGYMVGGIASFVVGKVSECFVDDSVILNGEYVGALVCNLYGSVDNCYSTCTLAGEVIDAGLVTFLWAGNVDKCYTYCSYTGLENSSSWADTSVCYVSRPELYGSMTNCIIIGKASETVKEIITVDPADESNNMYSYENVLDSENKPVKDELISSDGLYTIKSQDGRVNVKYQSGYLFQSNDGCNIYTSNQAIYSLDYEIYVQNKFDGENIWMLSVGEDGSRGLPKLQRAYEYVEFIEI